MEGYLDLLASDVGPLSKGLGEQRKVPDGIRYHVLDVWVEELREVVKENEREEKKGEVMMGIVRGLAREGLGKFLRQRAKECVREWEDGRQTNEEADRKNKTEGERTGNGSPGDDEEWDGFED